MVEIGKSRQIQKEMSIVLTFFKKRGSKEADDFRGVVGYRGCPLTEWDYLTLDSQLREIGVKMVIREYTDGNSLEAPYNTIVKKAICLDLNYGLDKSEQYPEKGALNSVAIKTWILGILKSKRPESLTPEPTENGSTDSGVSFSGSGNPVNSNDSSNSNGPGVAGKTEENKTETSTSGGTAEEVIDDSKGLLGFGLGLAGTLLVAALAIAGGVGGALLAENEDDGEVFVNTEIIDGEDNGSLFLVAQDETEEERISGMAKSVNLKKKNKEALAKEKAEKKREGKSERKPWEEAPPRQTTVVPEIQAQSINDQVQSADRGNVPVGDV